MDGIHNGVRLSAWQGRAASSKEPRGNLASSDPKARFRSYSLWVIPRAFFLLIQSKHSFNFQNMAIFAQKIHGKRGDLAPPGHDP